MKPEQIEELKKLSGAATPQPWVFGDADTGEGSVLGDESHGLAPDTHWWDPLREPDAELICAMRNALPTLLREREQLIDALKYALSEEAGFACPLATEERLQAAIAAAES